MGEVVNHSSKTITENMKIDKPTTIESQAHDRMVEVLGGNRTVLILYGTETGNSQDIAEDLARRVQRLHFSPTLDEMDGVKLSTLLKYSFVILVIATTGQGEFPRNSKAFWTNLRRKKLEETPNCLGALRFVSFGLGDSKYVQFNWAMRKLHKRLCQLGATQIVEPGEADEQHPEGIYGSFIPWAQTLEASILEQYPLPDSLARIPDNDLLPPLYPVDTVSAVISMSSSDSETIHESEPTSSEDNPYPDTLDLRPAASCHVDNPKRTKRHSMSYATNIRHSEISAQLTHHGKVFDPQVDCDNLLKDHPDKYTLASPAPDNNKPSSMPLPIPGSWTAKVETNMRITDDEHWQDVRNLTLKIQPKDLRSGKRVWTTLGPGDTLVIYPKNFPQDVDKLIALMGWQDIADKPIKFRTAAYNGTDRLMPVPKGFHLVADSTLRDLLTHNLDITSIPKRTFFDQVWHWSNNPTHVERLREFTDPKLIDEFFDYTSRPRRTMLEVLDEFDSVKIPLEYVAAIFPAIRGRHFSVANANVSEDGCVTAELIIALVKYKTVLQKTRQGLCSRYIEKLDLDTELNVEWCKQKWVVPQGHPVIGIATGTGVAPINFLLKERAEMRTLGMDVPKDILFFGNRHPFKDAILVPELFGKPGVTVHRAWSRWEGHPKQYVQDEIRKHSTAVARLLQRKVVVVICGSAGAMPAAAVQALFDTMIIEGLCDNQAQAEQAFNALKSEGRLIIIQEVW